MGTKTEKKYRLWEMKGFLFKGAPTDWSAYLIPKGPLGEEVVLVRTEESPPKDNLGWLGFFKNLF